jgi:hypothetical protein
MVSPTKAGKLISFPLSASILESVAQTWNRQILEARDNLVVALDFIQNESNGMLAGKPIKTAEEILSRAEAILRNDGKVPSYTVVAKIGIHGPTSRDANRKVLLLFPLSEALQ